MENYSSTLSPEQQIKIKLQNLLALTATNKDKLSMSSGSNGDSIISFSNDKNGKDSAIRFLSKLVVGGLINEKELQNAEDIIEHGTATPASLFVRIAADEKNIHINFNPHSHYYDVIKRMDMVIEAAEKDLKASPENLDKAWKDSPPSDAEKVVSHLEKKLKSVLAGRHLKANYSATETPEYKFHVTVSTNNRKVDLININKFLEKLNYSIGNDGKAEILQNDDPNRISFIVTGQPEKLLSHFTKHSFLNFFTRSKPSPAR